MTRRSSVGPQGMPDQRSRQQCKQDRPTFGVPYTATMRASKAAVHALTESLAVEGTPLGVRVHIVVLPGRAPETSFGTSAMPHLRGLDSADYRPMIDGMIASFRDDDG